MPKKKKRKYETEPEKITITMTERELRLCRASLAIAKPYTHGYLDREVSDLVEQLQVMIDNIDEARLLRGEV